MLTVWASFTSCTLSWTCYLSQSDGSVCLLSLSQYLLFYHTCLHYTNNHTSTERLGELFCIYFLFLMTKLCCTVLLLIINYLVNIEGSSNSSELVWLIHSSLINQTLTAVLKTIVRFVTIGQLMCVGELSSELVFYKYL